MRANINLDPAIPVQADHVCLAGSPYQCALSRSRDLAQDLTLNLTLDLDGRRSGVAEGKRTGRRGKICRAMVSFIRSCP